ncbi:MAG TPA: hypothetical protein VNT53_01440 [Pseudolysinimonas sp.]|nr:hypothetical protein [Pseudolysinimonas sp.]
MKRITYSGGSIVTGNAITAALLEYTTTVADAENSVTVDVTVLEENGETSVHTILLSPASQFDVVDVGGMSLEEEAKRFPVPHMPQVGIQGSVETDGHAARTADDFNELMDEIDNGLGQ